MKTFRPRIILFSIALIFLGSCLTEPKFEFEGYGDVYIQKKLVNGVNKYVPYYFAYANTGLSSVILTLPSATQVNLSPYQNDYYTFSNNPSASDYGNSIPAAGNYSFNVTTMDGDVKVMSDVLTADEIAVPVITEAAFKAASGGIYMKWNAVSGANAYNVKLFSQSGELVFSSTLMVITKTDLLIEQNTTGWVLGNPTYNTTYRAELHVYKFEEGSTDQNYLYNLQCESFAEASVTWQL